jgi:hypothetical protein
MYSMKRVSFVFAVLLSLTACGGGGGTVACENDYWDGTYGTCLPENWNVVNAETLRQRGVPQGTIAAFQSQIAVSGQFPSVTITREPLAEPVTPKVYSQASIRSVTTLPSYTQVDSKDVRIDSESLTIHVFTAQPLPEEPSRRFYQVSTVANGVGYTITGTTPVSPGESTEDEVQLILRESTFVETE